ncbi:nitronate monooxygenase, partial [Acinetobacter baumannii]
AAWVSHLQGHLDEFGGSISLPLKEIYQSFIVDTGMQQLVLELPPAVVSFHFGLPDAGVIQSLKNAGVFLMATATNLDEA